MSFVVVIPARYASQRLNAKALLKINDKPLVQHTWQRAQLSGAKRIIIATDNHEIYNECINFGAEVCMTSKDHQSGTDRIAEVVAKYNLANEIVVNLQGDEPLMPSEYLTQVADCLQQDNQASVATLAVKLEQDIGNENIVKVVLNKFNHAMYFSRSQIPYPRENNFTWYRHLGIYCYRGDFLKQYCELARSEIEQVESLEQLRVLWHGYKIHVGIVDKMPGPGVDSKEDFLKVQQILSNKDYQ